MKVNVAVDAADDADVAVVVVVMTNKPLNEHDVLLTTISTLYQEPFAPQSWVFSCRRCRRRLDPSQDGGCFL